MEPSEPAFEPTFIPAKPDDSTFCKYTYIPTAPQVVLPSPTTGTVTIRNQEFSGSNLVINAENCTIRGNDNTVHGNQCKVYGDRNTVYGFGDNTVVGNGSMVYSTRVVSSYPDGSSTVFWRPDGSLGMTMSIPANCSPKPYGK